MSDIQIRQGSYVRISHRPEDGRYQGLNIRGGLALGRYAKRRPVNAD